MMIAPAPRRIEVGHRRMLALALPMTLSHVTTPLLGLVDATVIGRLGEAHLLGAVALGAVIFDFLFWSFGSLRMATAGLTAQATGAGDRDEVDRTLARALSVAVVVGLALVVLQWPIAALAFRLAGASEAVTGALSTYFSMRIWAAPFTLANYVILGSTLAEVFGAGLGMLVLRRLGSNPFRVPRREILDRTAMLRTLAVNRDIMIRTTALVLAFAIFTAQGARAGDVTLAANAVLYNIFLIGGYFLDGFATAAETLCGQSIGARNERAFRRSVALSVAWSLGFGLAVTLLFLAGGGSFIDFVSTSPEVRAQARDHLAFAALTPLVGATAFAYDGIYIGATWTLAMRNLMLIAFAAFGLALLLGHDLGNTGLWVAFLAFLIIRGAGQAALCPGLTRRSFA